jgi:serine/threonine protein kinase
VKDSIPETASESVPTGPEVLQWSLELECAGKSEGAELPVVPGYQVLGLLGKGGMGIVYKAWQTSQQRLVALKMILAQEWAGPNDVKRFHTEAQAIARLEHPNIVRIYEVGDHAGSLYLALEFMAGGNLGRKMGGKPMSPCHAAQVIKTLARALQHVHERGIIHRDLKPANVLLNSDGIPKIGDFGLAKQFPRAFANVETIVLPQLHELMTRARMRQGTTTADDREAELTRSGAVLGTPSYMAPEQALGMTARIGPAADLHALGAILYQMLAGRPPFTGANLGEVLHHVRFQMPVPPSVLVADMPVDLETICLKCLQKRPAERYASAEALADDLHRFLAGERIETQLPAVAEVQTDSWLPRDIELGVSAMTHDEWEAWVCLRFGSPQALQSAEQKPGWVKQRQAPQSHESINRRSTIATIAIIVAMWGMVAGTLVAGRLGATVGGAALACVFYYFYFFFVGREKPKPMKMLLCAIASGFGSAVGVSLVEQEKSSVAMAAVFGALMPMMILGLLENLSEDWWEALIGWFTTLLKRKRK